MAHHILSSSVSLAPSSLPFVTRSAASPAPALGSLRIGILLLLRPANVLVSSGVASSSSGARATEDRAPEELELLLSLLRSSPNWFLQIWTLDPSCCQLKTFCFPWTRCAAVPRALLLPAVVSLLLLCCNNACGVCWQIGIRWRCFKLVISRSSVPLLWIT